MKNILPFITIIFMLSCSEMNSKVSKSDKLSEKQEIESDSLKIIDVGFKYDQVPKLIFETITEKEFLALEQKNYFETTKPEQTNQFFYLQTASKKHSFQKFGENEGENSDNGYEYLGFYPTLKLFTYTHSATAEGLVFSGLYLMDSLTDYCYAISSFGDGSVETPVPSINNQYLVYYYNSVYEEKNYDIGVLKINSKSDPENYLSEHASYHSEDFAIEKIVWKTDNCFYVKGYEEVHEIDKWVKKYSYYKTVFLR